MRQSGAHNVQHCCQPGLWRLPYYERLQVTWVRGVQYFWSADGFLWFSGGIELLVGCRVWDLLESSDYFKLF